MAFVVEDGTGLSNSNAYISLAQANEYFTDRLRTEWVGTDQKKQAAIIAASDYVDIHWERKLKYGRLTTTQAKAFPWAYTNSDNTPTNPMPVELIQATCEYALRALSAQLLNDDELSSGGSVIRRRRERLIQLEEEEHLETKPSMYINYPAADRLMIRLCKQAGCIRN